MPKGTIYEHREPTDVELAWLTGIWEGEGSWSYKKGRTRTFTNGKTYTEKPYIRMQMSMTDEDVMERVSDIMDGRKITSYDGGPKHKSNGVKPCWIITLQGEAAQRWTDLMKPYLGNRRREKYDLIMEKVNEIIKDAS
tara:strand:- start:894 stop:1307 length:414 start_codon:yes stop_codon:yes gene_type:complete